MPKYRQARTPAEKAAAILPPKGAAKSLGTGAAGKAAHQIQSRQRRIDALVEAASGPKRVK